MNLDWQNLIVLAIVAAAAVYIARLAWTSITARKASACGACRNCGTSEKTQDVFSITSQSSTKRAG
jgi:hypothetical protein